MQFKPSIRGAFRALPGCLAALFYFRADHPDRAKFKGILFLCLHAAHVKPTLHDVCSTKPPAAISTVIIFLPPGAALPAFRYNIVRTKGAPWQRRKLTPSTG